MKKKYNKSFLLALFGLIIAFGTFVGCSKDSDSLDFQFLEEQAKQTVKLNKETAAFKDDIVSVMTETATRASEDEFSFSVEQMKMLRESSLKMFQSHGFSEKEVLDAVENDELRLVFVATAFTALMEYPSTSSYSMPKTRSESGETCYDIERIKQCLWEVLKDAVGLYDLMESIEKKCITKNMRKYLIK